MRVTWGACEDNCKYRANHQLFGFGKKNKNKNKNSKIEPTEKINKKEKALHYITIVGGRHNIFKLLSIKYINSHKVALGMSMLASL